MTDTEAPAPTKTERKHTNKRFPSPYELYRLKFCRFCKDNDWCNANSQQRLICVWCALLDAKLRNNELTKLRGAHL